MTTRDARAGVVDSERGPLRVCHLRAAREFGDADGVVVRVVVDITRQVERGPVIVSSRSAMPIGKQFRYGQHIEPLEAWCAARAWLDELPAEYCVEVGCEDMRAREWSRFVRDFLAKVPCLEVTR